MAAQIITMWVAGMSFTGEDAFRGLEHKVERMTVKNWLDFHVEMRACDMQIAEHSNLCWDPSALLIKYQEKVSLCGETSL